VKARAHAEGRTIARAERKKRRKGERAKALQYWRADTHYKREKPNTDHPKETPIKKIRVPRQWGVKSEKRERGTRRPRKKARSNLLIYSNGKKVGNHKKTPLPVSRPRRVEMIDRDAGEYGGIARYIEKKQGRSAVCSEDSREGN